MPQPFELVSGRRKFFGPTLVKEAEERVEAIKENLKAA
jgi:hypothetical protein